MLDKILAITKKAKSDNYKQISLQEIAWRLRAQYKVNVGITEITDQLRSVGVIVEGNLVLLNGLLTAAHFHRLPQTTVSKVLKS